MRCKLVDSAIITEMKAYTIIIIVQGHRKENCSGEAQGGERACIPPIANRKPYKMGSLVVNYVIL